MKIKNQELFDVYVSKNSSDGYGRGILKFSQRWAELMEKQLDEGKTFEQMARLCERAADTDGITGFMYGCAVGFLSDVWEYGEELRRWHNLETQVGNEGEIANSEGGVLNPALLCLNG